ncbi:transcriptional regulator, XRE family with cupin sensor [Sanguibacter gelidistatuariae]|uniref:Transcriptional regulator, XRE family with cupin sensor n=1 Tax=Sanguibacter gelidistatuariae TaxID=1814289 RepID=A0A1G6GRN3_9MICO|nr:XRE family transcriptional regulator [Sanguibacter gelidistatuariae]SDB84559.1 transcriptional regulator, XRE family with cupin sensor [Sanguibacter gelidistatuariae]
MSSAVPDRSRTPITPVPESADERLGQVIRTRRHALGKTLVEVAAASELSHSFLSQLERGRARPSMRSLFLIAEALGTTQQSLLAEATPPSSPSTGLVDAASSPVLTVQKGSARLLSHVPDGADVTEFINVPDTFEGYFAHGRHEFVYVVSGHLEVELRSPADPATGAEHVELHSLNARQSIGYPGTTQHRHRRVGTEDCVILVVHSGPENVAGGALHTH